MDRCKSRGGKSRRREIVSRKKIREEKESEETDAGTQKGRKVAVFSLFSLFSGSGESKSSLAKALGLGR